METFIYFKERENSHGVIRFVKSFRKKSFLRKERIEYSFAAVDCCMFEDEEEVLDVITRVIKDYPEARIYESGWNVFEENFSTNYVWVIAHVDSKNKTDGYYYGIASNEYIWASDINEAEIYFDKGSADETLRNIRKSIKDKMYVQLIYTDLVNGLLEPNFMITCTSKRGNEETKFFKKIDGGRLRLVSTSDCATKFTYEGVLSMFENLQSKNKRFLYAVLPVFKENVHCRDLEKYMREKNVSRMVQMTTKMKWINR